MNKQQDLEQNKVINLNSNQPSNKNLQNVNKNINDDFDPDECPANFEKAEAHSLSMRVGEEDEKIKNPTFSISNGRQIERVPLDFWCETSELDFLGPGYPMFFEFVKYSIYMLLVLILSAGSYNFFSNLQGSDCLTATEVASGKESGNACVLNWSSVISLANKRRDESMNNLQEILNIFSIGAIIVLLQLFRRSQRETIQICDVGDIAAIDYTVMVKKIPKVIQDKAFEQNPDYDDYIKAYFEQQYKVKVTAVNIGFNLAELTKLKGEKEKLIKIFQKALGDFYKTGKWTAAKTRQQMQNDIKAVEDSCDTLCKQYSDAKQADVAKYWTGWAWVSFDTEKQKNDILALAEKQNGLYFPSKQTKSKIEIEPATQPSEVFWENLHFTTIDKLKRRGIGFLITIFTILVCYIIISFLANLQTEYNTLQSTSLKQLEAAQSSISPSSSSSKFLTHLSSSNTTTTNSTATKSTATTSTIASTVSIASSTTDEQSLSTMIENNKEMLFKVEIMAIVISVVIPILNKIIIIVMGMVTDFEKYSSRTEHSIVLATRLTTSMFFNSAIQTFLMKVFIPWVNFGPADARDTIIQPSGLIQNQQYVFLMNSFLTPFVYFADPARLFKIFMRKRAIKNKDKCTLTQKQLNVLFEEPNYSIALRYAYVLNSMFITAFYAPLIPVTLIWTVLGLAFTYFLDKYKLLYQSVVYYNMGETLSIEMTEVLEGFLPIYCTGYILYTYLIVRTLDENYQKGMYSETNQIANIFKAGYDVFEKSSYYAILGLIIGVVHMILPMQWFNEKVFYVKPAPENLMTYGEAKKDFNTNYDLENPATEERARMQQQKKLV